MNQPALTFHDQAPPMGNMAEEILAGLSDNPKHISPKFFYDAHGSALFDAITHLPEYYVTRTEIGILESAGPAISKAIGEHCDLIELGCGSLQKIRLLLESVKPAQFIPIDISKEHLLQSAESLALQFPWLQIQATCMDYSQQHQLPFSPIGDRTVAFFPGSSIGNFEPKQAIRLLEQVYKLVGEDGGLLIGVDLKKPVEVLEKAYNDSQNITAEFNKNILRHLNESLDADFETNRFEHVAFYNQEQGRIEMHLESTHDQLCNVAGHNITLEAGERIHTENSYKYHTEEFAALAHQIGFQLKEEWHDAKNFFSVMYFERN